MAAELHIFNYLVTYRQNHDKAGVIVPWKIKLKFLLPLINLKS